MDAPVREEGAADYAVILFTEVNDSLSIACEDTYSMHSHGTFPVLAFASYPCITVSKQEQVVVSWNVVNCNMQ